MFLKRIEMQGFKSFAEKVVINFDKSITGIVGPNGCGKSNITDAIRWVLGEQSAKSLRGSSMSDVIFSGSADRKQMNLAEVTLVFNNENKFLNSEFNEVEITRRIHRENSEGEYFINKTPVRLKDIQELIMDTGIGRDSLSMISQGNISSFAEARPVDRRALFEEAAGVSKYKKRKIESLSKLSRTQENLERVQDILSELERQVKPLKRAKDKALKYRDLRERLEKIEIAVLVSDITFFNDKLESLNEDLEKFQSDYAVFETSVNVHELKISESRSELRVIDREINELQNGILDVVSEIQVLETRRVEIDEKRKYLLESGSNEIKIQQLRSLLSEAKFEYDDRLARHKEISIEVEQLNQQLDATLDKHIKHNQSLNETNLVLRRLNSRQDVIKTMLEQPFRQQQGVNAILKAKNSIVGVHDVLANIIEVDDGFEQAISTALGGSMYFIVVEDERSSRDAINFLKANKSGRATFLPLSVIKPRFIRDQDEIILNNTEGYLGLGSHFIKNEEKFDNVVDSFLNNTVIADTLINAQELAKRLQYRYKVVTLEGEIINAGGSQTGGTSKDNFSPLTMQKELDKLEEDIIKNNEILQKYTNVANTIENTKLNIEASLMNNRISLAQLEPVIEAKRAKYERLQNELEVLSPNDSNNSEEDITFSDELIKLLNESYLKRDEMNILIKSKNNEKYQISNEIERREVQIRQIKVQYKDTLENLNEFKLNIVKAESKIDNDLQRLASEYQLTYEKAKQDYESSDYSNERSEVSTLRREIEDLGNVNMSAPEEYAEISERFDFIKHQYEDLVGSRDKLLTVIDEMDEVMTLEFEEMFHKINDELQDVFKKLFGGGTANLILENPDDLLNTGIDIDVQPPGKSVQNIRLFSGGEKALIAISVLFAILKARPVPLCIFDEVEAALDQANVERFSNYLNEFSKDTQFIVVTHRPGTMSKVDVLYGVTMPLQGVSQMLKVELKEARDFAEEVSANEFS